MLQTQYHNSYVYKYKHIWELTLDLFTCKLTCVFTKSIFIFKSLFIDKFIIVRSEIFFTVYRIYMIQHCFLQHNSVCKLLLRGQKGRNILYSRGYSRRLPLDLFRSSDGLYHSQSSLLVHLMNPRTNGKKSLLFSFKLSPNNVLRKPFLFTIGIYVMKFIWNFIIIIIIINIIML